MTRVAVTTSREASVHVADEFRRRGLVPVVLPCIRIERGDDADLVRLRDAAEDADWILVTSARAVEATWPDRALPAAPVAAVGRATARAVEERGGVVSLVGRAGAADLVDRLGDGDGRRIVFPHAGGADPETAGRLTASGWEVVDGIAYHTVPMAPASDPVDAAAFASPSAVRGWCSARSLEGIVVGAIGHTTAAALAAAGREPDLVPDRPAHDRLAAALAARFRGRITS